MKKRILSLVLCAAMLLSMCLFLGAGVAEDTTAEGSAETTESYIPAVNFTNVAPLVQANAQAANSPARAPLRASANDGSATPTDPLRKEHDALVTTKTATKNADGTYTIKLTSYTTGTVKEQTTTKPTDIVLVLDQSGSMAEKFSQVSRANADKEAGKTEGAYLTPDGEELRYNNGEWQYYYSGFLTSYWRSYSGDTFYSSRLLALKTAATTFVNQVSKEATENGVDHRIAIVGFSSNDNDDGGTDFKNTEILTGCTVNNNNNGVQYVAKPSSGTSDAYKDYIAACGTALVTPQSAKAAINYLEANGGTETDKGMQMAKDILDNDSKKNEDRNRVVVLFTDGVPLIYSSGWGADNDSTITKRANRAINTANSICGNATVYTVGVFSGANGDISKGLPQNNGSWENGTNKPNRFMHLVSSNYPDATAMDATGEKNSSLKNDDSYYLSAGDAATLNSIFEKISNNISTPSIELGTQAYVQDTVSDYFTAPADGNVTVTTEKAYYDENGNLQWKTDDNPPAGLTHKVTGKTVKVSGFDYDSNFVSGADKGRDESNQKNPGNFYGRRLVVTFTVKAEPGFLGGNNVPTNTSDSGVYDENEALVENFDYPRVNVPINTPELTSKGANVYYGGTVPTAKELCTTGTIGEKMDDYVNITYSVEGTVRNTTDGTYQVTMTVSPKYSGDNAKGTPATKETASVTSTVNVYKPEVTFKDCTTDYGVPPEYSTANFVGVEWKSSSGTSADDVAMTGDKPELTYAYMPVDNSFTKDTYVNVTVSANGAELPKGVVAFVHNDCTFSGCSFDSAQGQFIVHINVFDLTIVKAAADDSKPIDKDQTFVFKVTNTNTGKTMEVVITGDGQQTIKNLPMGSYTITEDTNWSWKYTPVDKDGAVVPSQTITATGATTVTFENENKGTNWLTSLAQVINTWATGKAELKK